MLNDAQRKLALSRARGVLRAESEAIRSAERHLGDEFTAATEIVIQALDARGRVCVTGVGKARLVGDKISATFASTGTQSYTLHPVEALHGDLGMVCPDDVVIGLSKSGGSELVRVLPLVREIGCKVILLTATPDSKAAQHADIVLNIGDTPEACPLGLAPSSSTAAMLALGDALALTVMELRSFGRQDYANRHPGGALGRSLMQAREIMRRGTDCPTVQESATLAECYEVMIKAPRRAGAAVVIDGTGHLRGILTQGDFFRFFDNLERLAERRVDGLMTTQPKCVNGNDRVGDALNLIREHGIDEVPVVDDDGILLGMIDIQDLIGSGFSVLDQP
ncbi:MAG: KpsF/GutQ family sugar-phosphate isomerase [Myxococcota bacterium]|nr:KpsF/GutQ family sugar-phosphate isomerase [Myxococcota bacterium]